MVGQLSVIVKPRVPKQPLGSDALTVKLYCPGGEIPVGVPLITPEAPRDNPFGSEPDARLQLYTTPVVYLYMDRLRLWVESKRKRRSKPSPTPA